MSFLAAYSGVILPAFSALFMVCTHRAFFEKSLKKEVKECEALPVVLAPQGFRY